MKRILLISVFALSSTVFFAAEKESTGEGKVTTCNVNGHITDKTNGEALTGVAVRLEGTDKVTYSDFNGDFSFGNLVPGSYTVETNLVSYKNEEVNIKAATSNIVELNISMESITEN